MFVDVSPAFLIARLFFIVCGCYLFLCVIAFRNSTKSVFRNDYLFAGLCLIVYSLSYGLMTITLNEELCRVFWAFGFVASFLFFTRWLMFLSNMLSIKRIFTRRLIKTTSVLALVISVICVLSNEATFVINEYGVHFSYYSSLVFRIAILFIFVIVLSTILFHIQWLHQAEMKRDRIQARLFLILSAFIAPIGFTTDFIIPTFTEHSTIPLATICFLPISMPFLLSMLKYKTLSITVPNASGYVFNTVTIPTLVLDLKNIINLENSAALEFFGSSVKGKSIYEIVSSGEKAPESSSYSGNGNADNDDSYAGNHDSNINSIDSYKNGDYLDNNDNRIDENDSYIDYSNSFIGNKVSIATPLGIRICEVVLAIENDKYHDVLCKVVMLKDITENEQKDKLLLEALEQAHSASKTKSDFLSNMSHEIRTPMNAIVGMTEIGKSSHLLEKKDDAFSKIEGASKHLIGLINDILDMSKIEANKFELTNVSFNFEEMLKNIVNVVNFRVEECRQKFYVSIGESIPRTLIGDDQRLSQVITNLLGNAIKFTPEGGTIRLDSRILSVENDTCCLQISVEDTGIGISDEQKSRLFRPFEQAEIDTTHKYGGTGLGLAISKRIVELMGGNIWVESEPEKGSKFIFYILLKYDTQDNETTLDVRSIWNNLHILVADADPELLDFFTFNAEAWGIACTVAASGREATEVLQKGTQFDICFLGWELPDMTGIELAEKIRLNAENNSDGEAVSVTVNKADDKTDTEPDTIADTEPNTEPNNIAANIAADNDNSIVIVSSSIDCSEIENKANAAGINRFLTKPLFPSAVIDIINECLGIRHTIEQENILSQPDDYSDYTIILAEDIEINREIVLAILEPTSLNIECVENGLQAVELFAKTPERFDLIFMDIQMPLMDGYEATRSIRALEVPQAETIPIIAMTANAFREDVDKCLAAGMNGHIGKPLDFNEVMKQLRKYLC